MIGKLFGRKEVVESVKPVEAVEPVIGEPVRAIIRAMEERPGTFGVFYTFTHEPCTLPVEEYVFTDRRTGIEVLAREKFEPTRLVPGYDLICRIFMPFEITGPEREALITAGKRLVNKKAERLQQIRAARRNRRSARSRAQWCEAYGVVA